MTTTATGATAATRSERDSMGEFEVPADAYYGASTMRAKVNFPISDLRLPRGFIHAIGLIKQQAALVNRELGLLDENSREPSFAPPRTWSTAPSTLSSSSTSSRPAAAPRRT